MRFLPSRNWLLVILLGVAGLSAAWAVTGAGRGSFSPAGLSPTEFSGETLPPGRNTLLLTFKSEVESRKQKPTKWEGSVSVDRGRVSQTTPWQDNSFNSAEENRFKLLTLHRIPRGAAVRSRGVDRMPIDDAQLLVVLDDVGTESRVEVKTNRGDFSFSLGEIGMGSQTAFLEEMAKVTRVPNTAKVVSAPTEDDFPAAAFSKDGTLFVAFTSFTHGKGFEARPKIDQPLDDFEFLKRAPGGDQLFLKVLQGGRWSSAIAVTDAGQNLFRPAVAVDGRGRAWIFWTAKKDGRWDLFCRGWSGGELTNVLQLSESPGPDLLPVAVTDSEGRVWAAWQAFGSNKSEILAVRQEGNSFGAPLSIAKGEANHWAPAIAASASGAVAFAWDSYSKGNYDVSARIWEKGRLGSPLDIANSLRAEKRASLAFDKTGRLWVAYEDSPEKWGKDWGALEKTGSRLFMDRGVGVRVWSNGQLLEPVTNPTGAFRTENVGRAEAGRNENLAAPRLAVGDDGRVWLAVRSAQVAGRGPAGSTWFSWLSAYDGSTWTEAAICPGTDGPLDVRVSLFASKATGLTLVSAADSRHAASNTIPLPMRRTFAKLTGEEPRRGGEPQGLWPDPVNSEIVMSGINSPFARPPAGDVQLRAVSGSVASSKDPEAAEEAAMVSKVRAHRATVAGKSVRVLRGEFHRHTEISGDGGGDGMLMDMWRYALDAVDFDWIGNGDHDNGNGREYSWWTIQKLTDLFRLAGVFEPMYTYERSVRYPDGHRNVVFSERGIRTLPRLEGGAGEDLDELPLEAERPHSPDTLMLYRYLKYFEGVCAVHTSGTSMGTDWRDNDPDVEPIVEIYQGDRQNYEMPGAPRANTADFSIGGWRPYGFVSNALNKGYRLGFQSSSDHASVHMSYCNVWVEEPTREAILDAMRKRHIYGSTDNLIGEFYCGEHFMGDEFSTSEKPRFRVRIVGSKPISKVHIIKDGNYVYSSEFQKADVSFSWADMNLTPGKKSYYYVRGEQADGELIWLSPMWITYNP